MKALNALDPEVKHARHQAKLAVAEFVDGAAAGDLERIAASFTSLDYGEIDGGGWARAMRAVSRLTSVPRATQSYFLQVYLQYGDHIRQECDDRVLADGLRILLPKYEGRAMRLFRGESLRNRSRRTYGLSWTACRDVARGFAEGGLYRTFDGGSVLLETVAPAAAIICAPHLLDDRYAEKEYILDRRRLTSVRAVERFPQLSHDELWRRRGDREILERFQHLQDMQHRLAQLTEADLTLASICERVLRSRAHIRRLHDELVESGGERVDFVRMELVNSLWWEIRALGFLRRWPRGKQTGPIQKALAALLEEHPDADTRAAILHLRSEIPDHKLKRRSVTVALSKARAARTKD